MILELFFDCGSHFSPLRPDRVGPPGSSSYPAPPGHRLRRSLEVDLSFFQWRWRMDREMCGKQVPGLESSGRWDVKIWSLALFPILVSSVLINPLLISTMFFSTSVSIEIPLSIAISSPFPLPALLSTLPFKARVLMFKAGVNKKPFAWPSFGRIFTPVEKCNKVEIYYRRNYFPVSHQCVVVVRISLVARHRPLVQSSWNTTQL